MKIVENENVIEEVKFESEIEVEEMEIEWKKIVVKISDELIAVPVKAVEIDNLDVGWLVNEVKRRYSK